MKARKLQLLATAMAWVGMLSSPLLAEVAPQVLPRDVALQQGGVLLGQVVDSQGGALINTPIVLFNGSKEIARVHTDRAGKFSVHGLKGGVYQVASTGQHGVYRLWAAQTAPPAAQLGLLLVSDNNFVRGQGCGCGVVDCGGACGSGSRQSPMRKVGAWLAEHPILTVGAIAAAIAIPLAVDDDDSNTNN